MFLKALLRPTAILSLLCSTTSAQFGVRPSTSVTSASPAPSAQVACNNSPSLCNRPYSNITHLGAHDSPFLRDESTQFSTSGNQYFNTTVQLDAGVRLLSAQVHKRNNTQGMEAWHLCHSSCDLLDAGTLSSWLTEIKTWMDTHPTDVVTILLVDADNATPAELDQHFQRSGIKRYIYTPPSQTAIPRTWPTLQTLISANTRLITFVASITPDPAFPYLMDEFSFIFENAFENEEPTDYSCTPDRPTSLTTTAQAAASGRMFLMNHFLYSVQLFGIQSPNDTYADVTNAPIGLGSLGVQLNVCGREYGRPPNFVLVDFFNVGPAIASVDRVNGITPVGRKSVTAEPVLESVNAGMGGRGASLLAVFLAGGAVVVMGL